MITTALIAYAAIAFVVSLLVLAAAIIYLVRSGPLP